MNSWGKSFGDLVNLGRHSRAQQKKSKIMVGNFGSKMAPVPLLHVTRFQTPPKSKQTTITKKSGQIIATSHDLTSHGRVVGDPALNGLISGKSRLVKYYNLARKNGVNGA